MSLFSDKSAFAQEQERLDRPATPAEQDAVKYKTLYEAAIENAVGVQKTAAQTARYGAALDEIRDWLNHGASHLSDEDFFTLHNALEAAGK
jgi:hypothetical protein